MIGAGILSAGVFLLLAWCEWRRPLRRRVESKLVHDSRNFAVAGMGAVVMALAESPVALRLSQVAERRHWGLLNALESPAWLKVALAVLLMDYTLYIWHVLTHKVPFLWRFHLVHHVDLDMNASTALRFHFGELALSVPWRAAQIAIIGISPRAFSMWQTMLIISIVFHHSNVRLPIRFERLLNRIFVTPRMHGIHHSMIKEETNANWSSCLTLWDWLHGTLRLNVPQEKITIGVPAYRDPADVTLPRILTMPFREQRSDWELP
jgi:sterol desaturase/sphingolipid hydroxylase (fatty acid hydroxylase superfamily)